MFLRACLDYVHTEVQTDFMQAGPKAGALEKRGHRIICDGKNLWSQVVQMPGSISAPFSKLGQVAQHEIPAVAQSRIIPE